MSKHRPSKDSTNYWLARVFKNSYTRGGKAFELANWSVKIQHAGERRAISLNGTSRPEAAAEAKALYEQITAQGWGILETARKILPASVQAPSKHGSEFWKERLIRRRSHLLDPRSHGYQLVARIEHEGQTFFFPTKLAEVEPASAYAQKIYDAVVKEGWTQACQQYPRELTVGFEWSAQPVMWTYTTIQTLLEKPPAQRKRIHAKTSLIRLLVIESDDGIRRALIRCLEEASERLQIFESSRPEDLSKVVTDCRPQIVLINRALTGRVAVISRHSLFICYTVAPDGDALFASTPGGAEGYIFKRISPTRLLEPICTARGQIDTSVETASSRARAYFKDLFLPTTSVEVVQLGKLTRREHEVLGLLSKGYMDKEIAEALRISAWTVHDHIKRIFARLRVRTRTEAVARYLEK